MFGEMGSVFSAVSCSAGITTLHLDWRGVQLVIRTETNQLRTELQRVLRRLDDLQYACEDQADLVIEDDEPAEALVDRALQALAATSRGVGPGNESALAP